MKKIISVTALLFLTVIICKAQLSSLVGKPAPPVIFQQNMGKVADPGFYKGKILVLDFWATWCAPCIANFPHYNQLAATYQNNDVVFALITDEPQSTVKKFFARTKKQVQGLNLLDTTGTTKKGFGVVFIPYSVVIDQNNIVRWAGLGQDLSAEILSAIIKGDSSATGSKADLSKTAVKNVPLKSVVPVFTFSVGPTGGGSMTGSASTNKGGDLVSVSRRNTPLGDVLNYLTDYSRNVRFISNDMARLDQTIDFNFDAKSDTLLFRKYANTIIPNKPRRNMIMELMGDAMKFNAKVIKRKGSYLELVVVDHARLNTFKPLQDKHSSISADNFPHFEIVGYNLKKMVGYLEDSAKMIITTDLAGPEEYDLSLDVTDLASLRKSLGFHGLGLVEKIGEVEYLDIRFY
ncbi:TlpA family protein disulfide reductase [Pedobacter namyangjuensis]|uniref:TlpA family protein disulfide reductase n=1 Tax=Pedobacter namyangjuensis TaxID=600626 RepID=UPI000DE2448C|nr:TlpA disulfide reductase family protein [Pedobacter namyangjuensis]